ncbi:9221_t:CDS:2, partial [Racocetra persica]
NIAKKKDIISKPDVREHDFRNASKSLDNLKSSFGELVIAAKQIRPKGIEGFINPRINNIAVIITRRPFDRDNRAFIEIAVRNGAVVYFGDYNPPRHTKRDLDGEYLSDMIFVDNILAFSGDSGSPVFCFSKFSDLRLVTINGILVATSGNITYPFAMMLPRKIILNNANLEIITGF